MDKTPVKIDKEAPEMLEIIIKDKDNVIFTDYSKSKIFSTGSTGYNCSGKLTNPKSGERYQVSINITLIGSKPKE